MFLEKDTGFDNGQTNQFDLLKAMIIFFNILKNLSSDFKSLIFFVDIDLPQISVIQFKAFP